MREIKFRAWDRKQKRWVYVTLWPNTISGPCPDYTSVSPLTHEGHIEALSYEDLDGWLEFTGLKDKNSKEIYEGDFIQYGQGGMNATTKKLYNDIQLIEWKYTNNSHDGGEFWGYNWIYGIAINQCEVVGNIFENPELTKPQ